MLRVGLTGGIGSGKSTASRFLAQRGAVIIDADLIAREVVGVGTPGLEQVTRRFGADVLRADGALDRPALGAIVFSDPVARRDLEAITHPLIGLRTTELFQAAAFDAIVVHDQPLLVEMGLAPGNHLAVVVGASQAIRLERMRRDRGMNERDARARIDAQASDAARHAVADAWLDNEGASAALEAQVASLWDLRLGPFEANLRADRRVRRDTSTPVVLHEPNDEWPARATRIISRVCHQLDSAHLPHAAVDHIGSTAVPGLIAKDVIDVQIQVEHLQNARQPEFVRALRAAGIVGLQAMSDTPHPWAPDRRDWGKYLAGGADPAIVVQIHIRQSGSPGAGAALVFRDWLRAIPQERSAYADFKQSVARCVSSQDYPEAKEPWFADAFLRARDWAHSNRR